MLKRKTLPLLTACLSLLVFSCKQKEKSFEENIEQVKQVVVIYMENHSFDNLWGEFEGADGLSNATEETIIQLDKNDSAYEFLPEVPRNKDFPTNLENEYFNIEDYVPADKNTPDVTHHFYRQQMQINGGKMNKFVTYNHTKGLAMGHYTTKNLPLYPLAKKYTLMDNFFHSGFGNSYFNHVFLISAAPAVWKDAPEDIVSEEDSAHNMIKDGLVTPDGYVIGTMFPREGPHPTKADTSRLLPPQTFPTIGDRLTEKDISWTWYTGGWDSAVVDRPSNYPYNHNSFAYFKNYGPDTEGRKNHLRDDTDFMKAAEEGTLSSVSFVKPGTGVDEHPGGSNPIAGQNKALEYINAVLDGPQADSTLIILTYDENGGFWDHVAPPVIDRWGPGTRIPAIAIGPMVKKDHVDNTQYETVSILAFIEKRWGLEPLTDRDANANPLENIFDFSDK